MNAIANTVAILVLISILAAVGAGGYFALDAVTRLYASLDPQTARLVSMGAAAALLMLVVVASVLRRISARTRARWLVAEKGATYRLFTDFWECILRGAVPAELARDRRTLTLMLSLYGSPSMVRAHLELEALERQGRAQSLQGRVRFAAALTEVRKDLGADAVAAHDLSELFTPGRTGQETAAAPADSGSAELSRTAP